MDYNPHNNHGVIVDEDGVLARWADWQGRSRRRWPLAALSTEVDEPVLFVADEVLVGASDRDLVEELVSQGASMVPEKPLLPPPPEIRQTREINDAEFPMPVRLRFAEAPRVDQPLASLTDLLSQTDEARANATITSAGAAAVMTLVAQYAAEGRDIGLNYVGDPVAMPLSSAQESASWLQPDPFQWQHFSGRSRIVQAWQLVESVRVVRSVEPVVWVAVLDGGFWVDGAGTPLLGTGETASDFGEGVLQVNLVDEGVPVGGPGGNKCGGNNCPWHGNQVASAAVAAVGNSQGAAGAGGTVGRPVFFKTVISTDQVFRCLQYCTAWGIDVLNISFTIEAGSELTFGTSAWNEAFQFATDNGVVVVAAAGNEGEELPGLNVRPATRTPGAITVGALDSNDSAAGFSNYGSSVSIWAPGTGIRVTPDGGNPNGSTQNGTSFAAPLVAGVAAMMRAVDSGLKSTDVRRILNETGWQGSGRVSKGLDAYAAVLAALKGALPADYGEPNNTAATAAELLPTGPGGSLQPIFGGFATRSGADPDYWKFQITQYSTVTVTLEWYKLLSGLFLSVETDDPDNSGPAEMTRTSTPATGKTVLAGFLPPGTYRVLIGGTADTAYQLNVNRKAGVVPEDAFEPNDSFGEATHMLFEPRKKTPFGLSILFEWGPGIFPATLHTVWSHIMNARVVNPDYYELEVPDSSVFRIPTVRIDNTDLPLDVTLYDEARHVIKSWPNVRKVEVTPPENSTCYLKVSGATANRYTIQTMLKVDQHAFPGPLEEVDVIPKWWGDPPPLRITERDKYFVVNVGEDRGDGDAIVFEKPEEALSLTLHDLAGNMVREGEQALDDRVAVNTQNLEPGRYLLRVARRAGDSGQMPTMQLRLAPPI